MNATERYLGLLEESLNFAKELGLENLQWDSIETKYQGKDDIQEIVNIVQGELFDFIEDFFKFHPYLGNMCLDLTAITFMYLRAKGFDAEIVYGNVNINNSPEDEWDTTPTFLKNEYVNKVNTGEQDVHAWVGLGGDIIIDFALPERLWKNYEYPREINFPIGRADFFENSLKVKYKPMLVGSDFFKQTNRYDPLDDIFNFKERMNKEKA